MEYREIDLKDWTRTGEGGTAESYDSISDPAVMLKLYTVDHGLTLAKYEFENSALISGTLGFSIPRALEIVTVGRRYGVIYEKIQKKKSFSRLCADHPEHIPEYARIFAAECKKIHSTACDTEHFPSQIRRLNKLAGSLKLTKKNREGVLSLISTLDPDAKICLHGDLQPGNIVTGLPFDRIDAEAAPGANAAPQDPDGVIPPFDPARRSCYLIDLGEFSYGDPLVDLGSLYLLVVFSKDLKMNQKLLHMDADQLDTFWKNFAAAYTGDEDPAAIDAFTAHIAPYGALFVMKMWYTKSFPLEFVKTGLFNFMIGKLLKKR